MMEREFVAQRIKEYQVQEFVDKSLGNVGHSHTIMKKTPLGEKIVIFASRPGLVVGRKGANIKELTKVLKKEFGLENPQIEISEVESIFLDPNIVAEKIVMSLERFGTTRFKGIGHKMMEKVMEAGARGIEIILSGKIPGARARSWRFYQGYVKKCGDGAQRAVRKATRSALLKPGIIGIRISIMPPNVRLPDDIRMKLPAQQETTEEGKSQAASEAPGQPKTEETADKDDSGAGDSGAKGEEAKKTRSSTKSKEAKQEKETKPKKKRAPRKKKTAEQESDIEHTEGQEKKQGTGANGNKSNEDAKTDASEVKNETQGTEGSAESGTGK